jgi:chaperonin GroEL (HSP60 family)
MNRNIKYLVVHCTATSQNAKPEAIQNYWKNDLKWQKPGYHILIDAAGKKHRLLQDDEVGNGVYGYNQTSLQASISVELSKNFNFTYFEISKGLTFDSGLIHPEFANNTNGNYSAENPYIWIDEDVISNPSDYIPYLEGFNSKKTPLVIIAKDFSNGFIRYCVTNKQQNGLNICLIKHPGFGDSIKENLKDIKSFCTNATVNKITVTPYEFTIYNKPDLKSLNKRVKQLKSYIENSTSEYEVNDYVKRISNLEQNSAIIYVGGFTEKEAKEEFDRIEDAVGACKSAIKKGVVPGQGVSLYKYAQDNKDILPIWFYKTLKQPALKILKNANLFLEPSEDPYNVKTKKIDKTLVDPTYVIICSLQNSFAMSKLIINSSYLLY